MENIQIQDRILKIVVTALLESIDLFLLQFLMHMITKYFCQAY